GAHGRGRPGRLAVDRPRGGRRGARRGRPRGRGRRRGARAARGAAHRPGRAPQGPPAGRTAPVPVGDRRTARSARPGPRRGDARPAALRHRTPRLPGGQLAPEPGALPPARLQAARRPGPAPRRPGRVPDAAPRPLNRAADTPGRPRPPLRPALPVPGLDHRNPPPDREDPMRAYHHPPVTPLTRPADPPARPPPPLRPAHPAPRPGHWHPSTNREDPVRANTPATAIDATGAPPLPDRTVLVEDGVITAVAPSARTPVPEGAETVDLTGRYLIPGLTDAHTHSNGAERIVPALYVLMGVTAVREMWGLDETRRLRDRIEAGELLGPRWSIAGNLIDGAPSLWGDLPGPHPPTIVSDAKEARRAVNESKDEGADFVKVY